MLKRFLSSCVTLSHTLVLAVSTSSPAKWGWENKVHFSFNMQRAKAFQSNNNRSLLQCHLFQRISLTNLSKIVSPPPLILLCIITIYHQHSLLRITCSPLLEPKLQCDFCSQSTVPTTGKHLTVTK